MDKDFRQKHSLTCCPCQNYKTYARYSEAGTRAKMQKHGRVLRFSEREKEGGRKKKEREEETESIFLQMLCRSASK